MQGLQVDIFGQQLQVHISLQLNVLSMSARSVALPLFSLASRTNAGCSLLEVYPMRFQMALCFICNICTHHLNTLALPFLPIVETENIVQHISVALSPRTYKSQGRNMLLMMISSIMMDNGNIQQPVMSCSSGIVHHHWCCHPC